MTGLSTAAGSGTHVGIDEHTAANGGAYVWHRASTLVANRSSGTRCLRTAAASTILGWGLALWGGIALSRRVAERACGCLDCWLVAVLRLRGLCPWVLIFTLATDLAGAPRLTATTGRGLSCIILRRDHLFDGVPRPRSKNVRSRARLPWRRNDRAALRPRPFKGVWQHRVIRH